MLRSRKSKFLSISIQKDCYMSTTDADPFRAANDLVQGRTAPNGDPLVGAFPTFTSDHHQPSGTLQNIYLAFTLAAAQSMPLRVGDADGIAIADENNLPAVFRAASSPRRSSMTVIRHGLPTFTYGQQRHHRTMNVCHFRDTAIVRTTVTFSELGLAGTALNDDASVRAVFASVHQAALRRGYAGGFPTFHEVSGQVEVVFLRDGTSLGVSPGGVAQPAWTFVDVAGFTAGPDPIHDAFAFVATDCDYLERKVFAPLLVGEQEDSLVERSLPSGAGADIDRRHGAGSQGIGAQVSAITTLDGQTTRTLTQHVLYCDRMLWHATRTPGSAWTRRIVDGDGDQSAGHVGNVVGGYSALVDNGLPLSPALHALYWDSDAGDLRHAAFDGTRWVAERVDGGEDNPTTGQILAAVGRSICATVEPDGTLHAFYLQWRARNGGLWSNALRHAWLSAGLWRCEQLDGAAQSGFPPGRGPVSASVGSRPSAVFWRGRLWVFYEDETNGNIRMAVGERISQAGTLSYRWSFQPLDGHSGRGGGTVSSLVQGPCTVTWNGKLGVFYLNPATGNLRMAARTNGDPETPWFYAVIDGPGRPGGARCGAKSFGLAAFTTARAGRPEHPEGPLSTLPVTLGYINANNGHLRLAALSPLTF